METILSQSYRLSRGGVFKIKLSNSPNMHYTLFRKISFAFHIKQKHTAQNEGNDLKIIWIFEAIYYKQNRLSEKYVIPVKNA